MFSQLYWNDIEEYRIWITLYLAKFRFTGDEIRYGWYTGTCPLRRLIIEVVQLKVIHARAFNATGFVNLFHLGLYFDDYGVVKFHADAFKGMPTIRTIIFESKQIDDLANGLFDEAALSLRILHFLIWPSNININEMFAKTVLRVLHFFYIENVQSPQLKFRQLAATNFTSFRRLRRLILMKCGIEAIDDDTFDAFWRTLEHVNLDGNRIKAIDLRTFRQIIELHSKPRISFESNEIAWNCTCPLLEFNVMLCPLSSDFCIDCVSSDDDFSIASCGIRHIEDLAKFGSDEKDKVLRYIAVRMVFGNDSVSIQTNFTAKFRVILTNLDAMRARKCTDRMTDEHFKCLQLWSSMDSLLLDIFHGAEWMSITVVPGFFEFGARPWHSITVPAPPLQDGNYLLMGILCSLPIGFFIGFVCGFCCKRKRAPNEAAVDQVMPYEYAEPAASIVIYTPPSDGSAATDITEYANVCEVVYDAPAPDTSTEIHAAEEGSEITEQAQ